MMFRALMLAVVAGLLTAGRTWAGGSGLNVIVVVNQNSARSVQLGNDYCELRAVPPQNLLRVTGWTGGAINWSPVQFTNYLLNPLLTMVAARGLTNQAQFVVLSMDIPYRVTDGTGQNSTTSALFYGFKTNGPPVLGIASCSLPDNSSNSYAYTELPFPQAPPNTAATNAFLAMLLTDTNLATAEVTLRRAVAADSSFPTQAVYLAKTSDTARSVRFVEFDNAVFENQVAGNFAVQRRATDASAFTNLFGLMTGLAAFALSPNEFQPGGIGDSLTSYGGYILESSSGQTPALAFLEAGAAGSYGTVVEPCNYTQKFPDPVDYFYQTRGFSLAEAYYQSLLNPFQGLMVGEPLAAPFAQRGSGDWSSLTNDTVLSGTALLNPVFTAATNHPLAQVDLFVDGTFFQTMTNLPLAAGNVLTATLNGVDVNYTVPPNATLAAVASGLANALNLQTNLTQVLAFPVGDRIELQSLALATPGSNVTLSTSAASGTAMNLSSRLMAARPTFLDSGAVGYQNAVIYGAPIVGDWLQFSFVKTNGTTVTLAVTNATAGTSINTLAQNLVNAINASVPLQMADGLMAADFYTGSLNGLPAVQFSLYARTPGWAAAQILATLNSSTNLQNLSVSASPLADNVSDLRPRNHLYVSSGQDVLPVNYACDTTRLADGWHQFTAVATEGTSVQTQTRVTRNVWIQNTSLTATLAGSPAGSAIALGQQWQFSVMANATNVARIELFSTGGSAGAVTNQATAAFVLATTNWGMGRHPFYAVVTDTGGNQFQTPTLWYRVVPALTFAMTGGGPALTWPATVGGQYALQSATNLANGFQTIATVVATNSTVQWPLNLTGSAGFYRVKLDP